jgi:hypothetical protein
VPRRAAQRQDALPATMQQYPTAGQEATILMTLTCRSSQCGGPLAAARPEPTGLLKRYGATALSEADEDRAASYQSPAHRAPQPKPAGIRAALGGWPGHAPCRGGQQGVQPPLDSATTHLGLVATRTSDRTRKADGQASERPAYTGWPRRAVIAGAASRSHASARGSTSLAPSSHRLRNTGSSLAEARESSW